MLTRIIFNGLVFVAVITLLVVVVLGTQALVQDFVLEPVKSIQAQWANPTPVPIIPDADLHWD